MQNNIPAFGALSFLILAKHQKSVPGLQAGISTMSNRSVEEIKHNNPKRPSGDRIFNFVSGAKYMSRGSVSVGKINSVGYAAIEFGS